MLRHSPTVRFRAAACRMAVFELSVEHRENQVGRISWKPESLRSLAVNGHGARMFIASNVDSDVEALIRFLHSDLDQVLWRSVLRMERPPQSPLSPDVLSAMLQMQEYLYGELLGLLAMHPSLSPSDAFEILSDVDSPYGSAMLEIEDIFEGGGGRSYVRDSILCLTNKFRWDPAWAQYLDERFPQLAGMPTEWVWAALFPAAPLPDSTEEAGKLTIAWHSPA